MTTSQTAAARNQLIHVQCACASGERNPRMVNTGTAPERNAQPRMPAAIHVALNMPVAALLLFSYPSDLDAVAANGDRMAALAVRLGIRGAMTMPVANRAVTWPRKFSGNSLRMANAMRFSRPTFATTADMANAPMTSHTELCANGLNAVVKSATLNITNSAMASTTTT